jgi:Domain of unknown function (DUF4158)
MKQRWTEEELEGLWTLHPEEFKLLKNKSGITKLSFALMLKYFQVFCRFPNNQETISPSIILHMAKQIGTTETNFIKGNSFSSSVAKVHRQQIRDFLGFRLSTEKDIPLFINWLVEKILPDGKDSFSFLQEKSYSYFQAAKVEPFSPMKIERHIRSALAIFEKNLFLKIFKSLDQNQKKSLLDLAADQDKQSTDTYYLRHLKEDAGNVSLESILEEVKKINRIADIGLPASLFKGMPHRILEKYKARVMSERPGEIRDHSDPIKYATLAIFCYVRGREIVDNLVDYMGSKPFLLI